MEECYYQLSGENDLVYCVHEKEVIDSKEGLQRTRIYESTCKRKGLEKKGE